MMDDTAMNLGRKAWKESADRGNKSHKNCEKSCTKPKTEATEPESHDQSGWKKNSGHLMFTIIIQCPIVQGQDLE